MRLAATVLSTIVGDMKMCTWPWVTWNHVFPWRRKRWLIWLLLLLTPYCSCTHTASTSGSESPEQQSFARNEVSACAWLHQHGLVSCYNPSRTVSISEKLLLFWSADLPHVSAASETLCTSSPLKWWTGSVMFMVELCDLKGLIQP